MTVYDYKIGTYAGGSAAITNLESLSPAVDPPQSTFHAYSMQLPLGDGTVRGGGWTTSTWLWNVLPVAQRDKLRTFIPGQSAEVFIRTKTMEADVYHTYSAVAIWPVEDETRDTRFRTNFKIEFQRMVQVD